MEKPRSECVTRFLLEGQRIPECAARGGDGVLVAHSGSSIACDVAIDVETHLLNEFPLSGGGREQRPKARAQRVEHIGVTLSVRAED